MKQSETFYLSALVKWNTQAYLKLLLSFTSHNDIIIKKKDMAWYMTNPSHPQQGLL